jgi:RNA polymerase sigma-70 factor (TIGR02960 family)
MRRCREGKGVGRPLFGSIGVLRGGDCERNGTCEDRLMNSSLIGLAVQGDEDAFRALTDPHRQELLFHCYRILGSMQDAEDALQETMLAAWRGLGDFEGRASLRGWLYRIATNRSLDALRAGERRQPSSPELSFSPPPPTRIVETTWLEPYPDDLLERIVDRSPGPEARYDSRESVELAFIEALQHLPPRQRAVLVLRDALGFRATEVAAMIDSTEGAVKSALKRARATMNELDERPGRAPAPEPNSPAERELVQRFSEAWVVGDIDLVLSLLTEDAWIRMPPAPLEYQGRATIRTFLISSERWREGRAHRLIPTRANTQPAFGCYRPSEHSPIAHSAGLMVLTLEGDKIAAITNFRDTSVLPRFGLPRTLSTAQ